MNHVISGTPEKSGDARTKVKGSVNLILFDFVNGFLRAEGSKRTMKYNGVGLYACNAKTRARELNVFSPPDRLTLITSG
jgi:hypothetical protein